MSDEEIKEKIKEIIDNPGDALEKGVKMGWKTVKNVGKETKDTVKKKLKEIEKEEKENYDAKYQSTRMVSDKGMK